MDKCLNLFCRNQEVCDSFEKSYNVSDNPAKWQYLYPYNDTRKCLYWGLKHGVNITGYVSTRGGINYFVTAIESN